MSTILVTGANGHLGRLVIDTLLDKGATVIAASRDPSKLADLTARGVETRHADFDDRASLEAAFAGVDRVLIISTDSLGSGQRLQQHLAAVAAAQAAGVGHIVYTSMPNPEGSAVTFAGDHLGTENAVKATGIPYTILRNAWYQENLFMSLPSALASGQWYSANGDGKIGHVARADCARAAAAVLFDPPVNQTLTLTGPQTFTTAEVADLVSEVTGKPIQVIGVSDEQLAGGLKHAGLPDALIPMLVSFDTNTRQGGFDIVTDAVEKLTGRAPVTLRGFLEANKDAF